MIAIASTIDHTILKAEATIAQVDAIIAQAKDFGFASVCVNGCFIEHVAEALEGSRVKPCAVAGFPLGAMPPGTLAHEAGDGVKRGAKEIDFVAPLRYLMTDAVDEAAEVMSRVVDAVRDAGDDIVVKVIIESGALMADVDQAVAERRIAQACDAAQRAGCDFVKTSTGFHNSGGSGGPGGSGGGGSGGGGSGGSGGATVEAVTLMRRYAGHMQVKASGGIRTYNDAKQMLDAGAARLGCSAGVAIVTGGQGQKAY